MRHLTQLVALKIDPCNLWPYCDILLSLARPDLLDFIERYVKVLQVLYQDDAVGDPIDVVVADVEELQIVQPSQVSAVNLLKLVVADVDPVYAFAEEEIGEAGDVVMAKVNAG